KKRS
ncbi:hypothetical protein D046_6135B, partial [Vibrio parahaemolyticus V-223/04]